jgi:ubiquinone/menaquinone biosynthesis C-methylase UbiE
MRDIEALYRIRFPGGERQRKDDIWQVLCRNFFQGFVRQEIDTILDVGCGFGEFSRHIHCHRKIAVDLNPEAGRLLPSDVEFHCCSAMEMPMIDDECIDVAFSSNFLEHLPSKNAVSETLFEIYRTLRPGGIYIALQPNIRFTYDQYWDFWDHHTALSDRSCSEAFSQAGFEVIRLIPKFLPYTTKSRLPTHPLIVRVYLALRPIWTLFGKQFLIVGKKPG